MVCTIQTILYLGQGPDNIQVQLVFFSTLEKLELPATIRGTKDCATAKLYVALPYHKTKRGYRLQSKIFWAGCLGCLCSWVATPHLLYHTGITCGTTGKSVTPSNIGLLKLPIQAE